MKAIKKYISCLLLTILFVTGCADNKLEVEPKDENFPFRLVLDADEGGDLADAEDYGIEVKFADFIGSLPEGSAVTVDYEISDLTDDMVGAVEIDEIVYEVNDEEFELDFTPNADGLSGTITLNDPTSGELPGEFEIVLKLPGVGETFFAEGAFKLTLSNLRADGANIVLGTPNEFEYEVLDHELAGSWELELGNADALDAFKEVFGSLSTDLGELEFADVKSGESIEVEIEFEFEEVNITLIYVDVNDEEVEIEIECDGYNFEDGEIELEGGHELAGDDGEGAGELDFLIEAEYEIVGSDVTFTFFKVVDEDSYEEGEELFISETGSAFTFEKD